jgi:hypothetical protein
MQNMKYLFKVPSIQNKAFITEFVEKENKNLYGIGPDCVLESKNRR